MVPRAESPAMTHRGSIANQRRPFPRISRYSPRTRDSFGNLSLIDQRRPRALSFRLALTFRTIRGSTFLAMTPPGVAARVVRAEIDRLDRRVSLDWPRNRITSGAPLRVRQRKGQDGRSERDAVIAGTRLWS